MRPASSPSKTAGSAYRTGAISCASDKSVKRHVLPHCQLLRAGALNVPTLTEAGKAELLADELARYKLAFCGLSEVRWPGSGDKLMQGGATGEPWRVLYSGRTDGKRQQGVAIAVCQSVCKALLTFNPISPRLITATFHTLTTPVTIV